MFDLAGNALIPGQPQQLSRSAPGRGKDSGTVLVLLHLIAGQADRHALCLPQQRAQYRQFLGREVRKAVQPQIFSFGPTAVLQFFRHPGQSIPGVQGRLGGQSVIGGQDQAQIMELISVTVLLLRSRPQQLLRQYLTALQLIRRCQQGL